MTQADTASAVRRSLDSKPVRGQGQALATTPLPDGWQAFCSEPDHHWKSPAWWYAVAPWSPSVLAMKGTDLVQTVEAPTWALLHERVAEQIELHRYWTGGA